MKINSKLRSLIKKKVLEEIRNPEAREIVVKTPYKMSEEQLHAVRSQFSQLQSARLVNEVDDSLIGGIIFIDGSMIFDYSVKGKMNELVDTLLD